MESRVVKKPREPKGVRNKKTLTPWNGVVDNPDDYEGFVHCITRNDGKYYVGMKFTKSRRRVKQKDSTRRKRVEKDSDWSAVEVLAIGGVATAIGIIAGNIFSI